MTVDEQEIVEAEAVEETQHLPAVRASEAVVARGEITVDELIEQAQKIQQVMQRAMRENVHYGKIPGVNKPTLLKPGAEMLNVTLRLAPSYDSEKHFQDGGHLTVVSRCTLTHIPTGLVIAQGEGLCSTRESKYAYRTGGRSCPECGAEGTIKKSKYKPRSGDYDGADPNDPPGFYCYGKIGGCGTNFAFDDRRIVDQPEATKIDNPDLPDTWNTVLKMADKRALVAAVLNGTAASDVFTQDVEDAGTAAADKHEVNETPDSPGFDPGRDLAEAAQQWSGNDGIKKLNGQMVALNNKVDWAQLVEDTIKAQFGVEGGRKMLHEDQVPEWWRRMRNAVVRMLDEAVDFDGEKASSPEQVTTAFRWAFPSWEGALPVVKEPEEKGEAVLTAEQAAEIDRQLDSDDIKF